MKMPASSNISTPQYHDFILSTQKREINRLIGIYEKAIECKQAMRALGPEDGLGYIDKNNELGELESSLKRMALPELEDLREKFSMRQITDLQGRLSYWKNLLGKQFKAVPSVKPASEGQLPSIKPATEPLPSAKPVTEGLLPDNPPSTEELPVKPVSTGQLVAKPASEGQLLTKPQSTDWRTHFNFSQVIAAACGGAEAYAAIQPIQSRKDLAVTMESEWMKKNSEALRQLSTFSKFQDGSGELLVVKFDRSHAHIFSFINGKAMHTLSCAEKGRRDHKSLNSIHLVALTHFVLPMRIGALNSALICSFPKDYPKEVLALIGDYAEPTAIIPFANFDRRTCLMCSNH